jgi:hypothetical protein
LGAYKIKSSPISLSNGKVKALLKRYKTGLKALALSLLNTFGALLFLEGTAVESISYSQNVTKKIYA